MWYLSVRNTEVHDGTSNVIKAPPYQGEAFSFCTVSSAGACRRRRVRAAAAAPRMETASHPCHPDIYKTAFLIHLVFNILDTSINT